MVVWKCVRPGKYTSTIKGHVVQLYLSRVGKHAGRWILRRKDPDRMELIDHSDFETAARVATAVILHSWPPYTAEFAAAHSKKPARPTTEAAESAPETLPAPWIPVRYSQDGKKTVVSWEAKCRGFQVLVTKIDRVDEPCDAWYVRCRPLSIEEKLNNKDLIHAADEALNFVQQVVTDISEIMVCLQITHSSRTHL